MEIKLYATEDAYDGQSVFTGRQLTPPGTLKRKTKMTGSKIIVVSCNGDYSYPTEHDTMAEAETAASNLAHKTQSDVYILRPVKKISPKRDVVSVDLPLE